MHTHTRPSRGASNTLLNTTVHHDLTYHAFLQFGVRCYATRKLVHYFPSKQHLDTLGWIQIRRQGPLRHKGDEEQKHGLR